MFTGIITDIGRIEAIAHDHALDPRIARHVDVGIGHDEDLEPVALRHAIDLGLHRAGIGIDIDHAKSASAWKAI